MEGPSLALASLLSRPKVVQGILWPGRESGHGCPLQSLSFPKVTSRRRHPMASTTNLISLS